MNHINLPLAGPDDKYYSPKQVEQKFNIPYDTLRKLRENGTGPLWVKWGTGRSSPIRYRRSDILAYLETHTFKSVPEANAARKAELAGAT